MPKQLTPLRRKDQATGYQAAVKDIVAVIEAQIKFHRSASDAGAKAGVDMPSIDGGVSALRMLQRYIQREFGTPNVAD